MLNIEKIIDKNFEKLLKTYNFRKREVVQADQYFTILYSSKYFVIKIEKYRRELYTTLYKINDPDNGINLINLLNYLRQESSEVLKANYFEREEDIEICYNKQIDNISNLIYNNIEDINIYFNTYTYKSNFKNLQNFMKNKYPRLFKTN